MADSTDRKETGIDLTGRDEYGKRFQVVNRTRRCKVKFKRSSRPKNGLVSIFKPDSMFRRD